MTVAFGFETEEWGGTPEEIEDQAKETFLEYVGTVSDNWIKEALSVRIEYDDDPDPVQHAIGIPD
jgi:hypothetical protein